MKFKAFKEIIDGFSTDQYENYEVRIEHGGGPYDTPPGASVKSVEIDDKMKEILIIV